MKKSCVAKKKCDLIGLSHLILLIFKIYMYTYILKNRVFGVAQGQIIKFRKKNGIIFTCNLMIILRIVFCYHNFGKIRDILIYVYITYIHKLKPTKTTAYIGILYKKFAWTRMGKCWVQKTKSVFILLKLLVKWKCESIQYKAIYI